MLIFSIEKNSKQENPAKFKYYFDTGQYLNVLFVDRWLKHLFQIDFNHWMNMYSISLIFFEIGWLSFEYTV